MMSNTDYIISLQKEVQRLSKLVNFYEEIILSNEELKEMYRDKLREYAGSKDRRNKGDRKCQKR